MLELTHCLSYAAPLVHELLISNKFHYKCHYCGRTYLSNESYSDSALSDNYISSNEDLNSPAEQPINTKLRLISKPGVYFYTELKGQHDFKTSLFAVIFSLSFLISISLT